MSSEIQEFFKNQTLFITGGSGFLGKLFIEKLLRDCIKIQKIYVLMRPKKGKSAKDRFEEFFNYACFDVLKSKNPDALQKVALISGDCYQPFLGLNDDDTKILVEETTCVIHAAASVKFDQTLKEAALNVRATKDVTELAKKMTKLRVFVYISTAFSHCITTHIKEEFYEPPLKLQELLTLVNAVDDETLKAVTPVILKKWPNTYVYTKCISEDVVKSASQELPVVIIRPAIITSTASEPIPGWVDNFYGAVGIVCGGALGVIRTLNAKYDATAQIVPADCVVNCALAAAWYREHSGTTTIYNCATHKNNPITWDFFPRVLWNFRYELITEKVVWYPTLQLRENETWNKICSFFLHTVLAYVADFALFCLGKPRIAVKAYERLDKQLSLISYFSTRDWDFDSKNVGELWNHMKEEDKRMFYFNMETLDWEQYFYDGVKGGRVYLLKDSMDTLPRARRKYNMLAVAHYTSLALFYYLIYKIVMFIIGFFY